MVSDMVRHRAKYARANQPYGDLLVNSPNGFPSEYPPVAIWYYGNDTWAGLATSGATMSTVTRATSLIVNTLSSLPMRHLAADNTAFPRISTIELPLPRWVGDPMLYRTDLRYGQSASAAATRMTMPSFWSEFLRSALLKGMGYLIFESDASGAPLAGTLRLLNPDYVQSQRSAEGYINRRIGIEEYVETDREGRFSIGGRQYRLLELLNPLSEVDEYGTTQGVLTMHARELGLAQQAIEYGSGMYRSGVPAGYLKLNVPNASDALIKGLKETWMQAHGNDRKSIAVLNSITDFTPIQLSAVDAQLIESRMMSISDVANAFGVPASLLNGKSGDSMTYSNVESRSMDFKQFTLQPWASAFESVLSSLLAVGQWLEIDFRGFLRADITTRYAAYATALGAGFLTVDEVRQLEGLPAIESQPFGSGTGVPPQPEGVPENGT